jgi:hypothetical protein
MAAPVRGRTFGVMDSQPSRGGTGFLAIVAIATIFIVTIECVFLAVASYWLLAVVLTALILAAVAVMGAVITLIDYDELELRPPRPVVAQQPAERPEPVIVRRPAAAG